MEKTAKRIENVVRTALPGIMHTVWWLVKITVGVSFAVMCLNYLGLIPWLSRHLTPFFSAFGLPGEASLAYVSAYFVNCYSGIAVITTLHLDARCTTIMAVMILCSHNMITETMVQRKTGTSALRMVALRTLSGLFLGWLLNLVLPGKGVIEPVEWMSVERLSFWVILKDWAVSTAGVVLKMVVLVFSLTLLQRLLAEFGAIRYIARFLRPVMRFFGLPPKTAFLWIVANILGLAYGAAVMIDESKAGKVTRRDIDLLNHHIGIAHSNLEDLILFASVGGMVPWMLGIRWAWALVLVWERRLENLLGDRIKDKRSQKTATA